MLHALAEAVVAGQLERPARDGFGDRGQAQPDGGQGARIAAHIEASRPGSSQHTSAGSPASRISHQSGLALGFGLATLKWITAGVRVAFAALASRRSSHIR